MRKVAVVLSVVLLVSPGLATITYTPMPPAAHGVGLYNPADPTTLNTVYVDPAYLSDVFTFTFAIHHNDIWYRAEALHFTFGYDNYSIEVLHAQPLGSWTADNYDTHTWPNTSHGWIEVNSLWQGFTITTDYEWQGTSSVVPFMQVQLHIKSDWTSQINMFGVVAMTLWSHDYQITLTPATWVYGMGFIHEVPEPSSVMLLGGVVTAMAGGAVRRLRRS